MPSKAFDDLMHLLEVLPEPNDTSFESRRINLEEKLAQLPMVEGVICEPVPMDHINAQWLLPAEISSDLVVLFLHGGGYCLGSNLTHQSMVSYIANGLQAKALMIEYRLAPENPFPAALEDAVKAYQWLLSQGYSPERLIIAGDSAGGGLTLATMMHLREKDITLPAAGVCLSPWADLSASGDSYRTKAEEDPIVQKAPILELADAYLAGEDPKTPFASPVFGDLTGLPPLLIQVGSSEVLLDDSRRLAANAKTVGVEVSLEVWDQMVHVWQLFSAILPEGREAIEEVVRFILERTGGESRVH